MRIDPPTEEQYAAARNRIARAFAPRIYACKKCGWPVADGYCCQTCGDNDPKSN